MTGPKILLYHRTGSRSARIVWLLEEMGLPYEVVSFDSVAAQKTPEFFAKHPGGQVPAIEVDGITVWESGAIVQFLLERYGNGKLAPPIESALRGDFLKWLWFAEATLAVPLVDVFHHTKPNPVVPAGKQVPAIEPLAMERTLSRLRVVEEALQGRPFLLGEEFSAADIMLGYTLNLACNPNRCAIIGPDSKDFPAIAAYFASLSGRPGFKKAFAPSV